MSFPALRRAFAPAVMLAVLALWGGTPGVGADAAKWRERLSKGDADERYLSIQAAATGKDATSALPLLEAGMDADQGHLAVACGDGILWLARVRPSGRKEMSGADYANGARLKIGERLAVRA